MLNVKLEHFRNLISLAGVDGKIMEEEKVALSKIAYDQGIPLDRLNLMLDHSNEYAYIIPQNQEDREKQLNDMIELALIDDDFAPAEKELILTVGERLGFSNGEIEQIIKSHIASDN